MNRKLSTKISLVFSLLFVVFIFSPQTHATTKPTTFESGASTFPFWRRITFSAPVDTSHISITNKFTYTITAAADNPSGAINIPTTATVDFNQASVDTPDDPDDPGDPVVSMRGEVDFCPQNNCAAFESPGIYRYTIAETFSGDSTASPPVDNSALFPLDSTEYTIAIEVVYPTDNYDRPDTSSLVATVVEVGENNSSNQKEDAVWENEAKLTLIALGATAHGNDISSSECFDYTITIQSSPETSVIGSGYVVNTSIVTSLNPPDAIASSCQYQDSPNFIAGVGQAHGFSLAHGEVMWAAIPLGASYTITAQPGANGDSSLVTTLDGNTSPLSVTKTAADVDYTGLAQQYTAGNPTQNATFVDRIREVPILSGIFTNIWFYLALIVIVSVGIFVAVFRRKTPAKLIKKK